MTVLFVGQSLPVGAPIGEFAYGTSTEKRLFRWIMALISLQNCRPVLWNVSAPGAAKARRVDLIKLETTIFTLKPERVIALGKVARRALDRLNVPCWELPHPSARGMKMADARGVQNELEECRKWLRGAPFGYPH